jgi:hypothetical protein
VNVLEKGWLGLMLSLGVSQIVAAEPVDDDGIVACPLEAAAPDSEQSVREATLVAAEVVPVSGQAASADVQLVVINTNNDSRVVPIDGATRVEPGKLASLVRTAQMPLLIAGTGYDDQRLAHRVARWRSDEVAVKVIRWGVPAVVLNSEIAVSDHTLTELLAVPASQAISLLHQPDWLVVALEGATVPTVEAGAEGWSPEKLVEELVNGDAAGNVGVLLVDSGDGKAGPLAAETSRSLGFPVFHVEGGSDSLQRHHGDFLVMNRQPAGRAHEGCRR